MQDAFLIQISIETLSGFSQISYFLYFVRNIDFVNILGHFVVLPILVNNRIVRIAHWPVLSYCMASLPSLWNIVTFMLVSDCIMMELNLNSIAEEGNQNLRLVVERIGNKVVLC